MVLPPELAASALLATCVQASARACPAVRVYPRSRAQSTTARRHLAATAAAAAAPALRARAARQLDAACCAFTATFSTGPRALQCVPCLDPLHGVGLAFPCPRLLTRSVFSRAPFRRSAAARTRPWSTTARFSTRPMPRRLLRRSKCRTWRWSVRERASCVIPHGAEKQGDEWLMNEAVGASMEQFRPDCMECACQPGFDGQGPDVTSLRIIHPACTTYAG